MDSFTGKLAVVTGGGSGMGRELVRQLAAQGCSVAACDLNADAVAQTAALAREGAPPGVRISGHACDVAEEAQVLRFRGELLEQHASDHVDLVFSNAGIGGGGSFVNDRREDWERTFAVDWWGVYYCARAFLPLLIASGDGVLVNTSSVNGFWATLGPGTRASTGSCARSRKTPTTTLCWPAWRHRTRAARRASGPVAGRRRLAANPGAEAGGRLIP